MNPFVREPVLFVVLTIGLLPAATAQSPSGTRVGDAVPGTPQIFGAGAVSTAEPEFGLALSSDGQTAYFNRASADRSRISAMESRLVNGAWQPAVPVPFADTAYRDLDLFVSPDGSRLFFTSNRPVTGSRPKGDLDLWYAPRLGGAAGWGPAVRLPEPVNTSSEEVFCSVTATGTLYFASGRGGNSDIYRAQLVNGRYATVERLPDTINTPGSESNPLISPDESFLIFVAERPEGLGGGDLYVSRRVNGQWTAPRNLGPAVNSAHLDFAPGLSPDGKYLFFTSERPGVVRDSVPGRRPGDIYQIELKSISAMR